MEQGDNSPARKRKLTSDAWSTIKIIKNNDLLTSDKEWMTHFCAKCGAMTKCSKDKTKGAWLTVRYIAHVKKDTNYSEPINS